MRFIDDYVRKVGEGYKLAQARSEIVAQCRSACTNTEFFFSRAPDECGKFAFDYLKEIHSLDVKASGRHIQSGYSLYALLHPMQWYSDERLRNEIGLAEVRPT